MGEIMSRIIFRKGRYYEEFAPGPPIENGAELFRTQFEHDLRSAGRRQKELRRELAERIVKSSVCVVWIIIGLLFLWIFVNVVHWSWLRPVR
jgi:uncharacterized membrane protein